MFFMVLMNLRAKYPSNTQIQQIREKNKIGVREMEDRE